MPVVNTTPRKQLTSCDAAAGAVFAVAVNGCDLDLVNLSSLTGITNIKYEISLGATVVDTINTTSTTYTWDAGSLYYGDTLSIKQTITSSSGTFEVTQSYGVPSSLSACVFEYTSNLAGADTFAPASATTSGTTLWRTPDDTYQRDLSPSVGAGSVGFDGTNQNVRVRPTGGLNALAEIDISAEDVVGFVDFNKLTATTTILANSNANLTSVSVTSCAALVNLQLHICNLTALNLSGLLNLDIVYCYANSNLTSLILDTACSYADLRFYSCDLSGTFDLSTQALATGARIEGQNNSFTGLTTPASLRTVTRLDFSNNSISGALDMTFVDFQDPGSFLFLNNNLTSVDHTGRSGKMFQYDVSENNITGGLDISMFTHDLAAGRNLDFRANDNPLLTGVTIDTVAAGRINIFRVQNTACGVVSFGNNTIIAAAQISFTDCNLVVAETNENLVNIRDAAVSSGATGSVGMGGTNAAPTAGPPDGDGAVTDLTAAGYTVTTS